MILLASSAQKGRPNGTMSRWLFENRKGQGWAAKEGKREDIRCIPCYGDFAEMGG